MMEGTCAHHIGRPLDLFTGNTFRFHVDVCLTKSRTKCNRCPVFRILVQSGVLALVLYLFRTHVPGGENAEYPSPSLS